MARGLDAKRWDFVKHRVVNKVIQKFDMKKVLLFILISLVLFTLSYILLQNGNRTASVQMFDSDSLVIQKTDRQTEKKQEYINTGFIWKDSKGDEYPVCMSGTDSCFVIKTSKSGEKYRAYLGEEASEQIRNELMRKGKMRFGDISPNHSFEKR